MSYRFDEFLSSIKRFSRSFCLVFVVISLCSCAKLSKLEKESFTEIEKLQSQFENNSENALFHMKLGSEYEKLGKKQSSKYYYKKAIDEYSKALELEPDNLSLKFSLYQLSYFGVTDYFAELEDLISLYNTIDYPLRKNLDPPHLALFYRQTSRVSYDTISDKQLLDTLYKALEENPLNARVSYLLSIFLIDDKHYVLAIDVLKRSLDLNSDNQYLNLQLGIAYEAYANQEYCPFEHQTELKKSLDFLQKAAKEIPNDLELNHKLATLYERLNVSILMVDVAKKLVAADPSPNSQLTLAEALSNAGQQVKALAIYDELIDQGIVDAYLDRAMIYAENGDWERSYASSKAYMKQKASVPLYPALLHLVMEDILSKEVTTQSEMSRYVNIESLDNWEKALYKYWYGSTSEKELIELADNICKTAESNFLIGIKKLKNNEKELAKRNFESVLASKTYSFVEYRVSKHLIKMIEN